MKNIQQNNVSQYQFPNAEENRKKEKKSLRKVTGEPPTPPPKNPQPKVKGLKHTIKLS